MNAQKLPSEAAYRFSRGVHPEMANRGVSRCLELMRQWSGGVVAQGLVDEYPLPPKDPIVEITPSQVKRWLGVDLSPAADRRNSQTAWSLKLNSNGDIIRALSPDHRLDIGEGIIGLADVMEEIARIYGYERIPETLLADELPPQWGSTDPWRASRKCVSFWSTLDCRRSSPIG